MIIFQIQVFYWHKNNYNGKGAMNIQEHYCVLNLYNNMYIHKKYKKTQQHLLSISVGSKKNYISICIYITFLSTYTTSCRCTTAIMRRRNVKFSFYKYILFINKLNPKGGSRVYPIKISRKNIS